MVERDQTVGRASFFLWRTNSGVFLSFGCLRSLSNILLPNMFLVLTLLQTANARPARGLAKQECADRPHKCV